jgi:ABC-2 type transport system ATP-binding protein
MIRAHELCRRFGRHEAVRGLDLEVRAGEIYGFLGSNGAGKTTSLRMLAGLLEPTSGSVEILGRTYQDAGRELRRRVGWVPDTPPLFEDLTPRQHTALVASLFGVGRRERDERTERLFAELDLEEHADRPCRAASHGMRKKTHLAAVLVTEPDVLLLDEPSTGLDPRSAHRLAGILRACRERGNAVLLSTHVLSAAERLCDRVGIIDRGTLRAEGTLAELRAGGGDEAADLEQIFLRLTEPGGGEGGQADAGPGGVPGGEPGGEGADADAAAGPR